MPVALRRSAAGLLAGVLLLTGCGDLEEAASANGIARNDLVSQMLNQLAGGSTLTYTASYRLPRGVTATVTQAQNPSRTAYDYPAGRLVVTARSITTCESSPLPVRCTITEPPRSSQPPVTAPQRAGMITPAAVGALLDAASLDTAVTVSPHDTTVAGHHATCLDLAGVDEASAREFSVCVTSDGVVGTFQGTVSGHQIDMTMTEYDPSAPPAAFTPPPGAQVVDKR